MILTVNISEIKTNPNNPRIIKDDKFKKLVKSIQDFPEMLNIRPIVVNSDMIVLGGNMRLKACREAGLKEIPIIYAENLTEEQQREFIIKDNVGFGEWDWEDLGINWDKEELEEWGLDLPEFEKEVLEATDDDYEIPEEIKTDIVLGDLFEIGEHRLLCGSSTNADDVTKLMNGNKANMVFTDPPYGVSYVGGVIHGNKINTTHKREMLKNDEVDVYSDFISLLPLIIDNGALYIFYAVKNSYEIFKPLKENNIDIMSVLTWIKINTGYADMNSHYKNRYEPFVYCKIGQKTNFIGSTTENTTWEIEKDRDNKLHPTQKPISVPLRAIGNHNAEIVADLFSGSGSTMVASHQLKRKCYGMELDPKYCQVIVDRMIKLDPSLKIKRNGQEYIKQPSNSHEQ
jgi:site-specific DNA-methyltransferase (adenine-specific)